MSLIPSLECECVHRPPPALPIPLLIIMMSEKRSSGRGCWQQFDWVVVLAYTNQMKQLLLYVTQQLIVAVSEKLVEAKLYTVFWQFGKVWQHTEDNKKSQILFKTCPQF